jgi:AraC-like DNA-binding protein/mannose-6-phosphate isomerase-like protein (cupin superfamily)
MTKSKLPVFNITLFQYPGKEDGFYANTITRHLEQFHFVFHPHRLDFFLTLVCTAGSGKHTIDFVTYDVKPGSVFLISPGQVHRFDVSKNIDGYAIFHTRDFYETNFASRCMKDYPFFGSVYNAPYLQLKKKQQDIFYTICADMVSEYRGDQLLKFRKLCTMLDLLYVELSRLYIPAEMQNHPNSHLLTKVITLEGLIEKHFRAVRHAGAYAEMMNMSERHLNRICRTVVNKTVTDFIFDRVILEAKRLLAHSGSSVSEVAEALGYLDHSYFSRLFKKKTGETPAEFSRKHR